MKEDELRRIEAELRLTLPDDYRRLMLAFPFRPLGRDSVYWLYDDPDDVIRATREPLHGYYEGAALLPTHVAIGETAMGDQYLLNLARTPWPVLCLSHETHEVEEDYPDLASFVTGWTKEVAEPTEQSERNRPRRWWKFWS